MESSEYPHFSQYEYGPMVDLESWRRELIGYTEAHVGFLIDELHRRYGHAIDIDAPHNEHLINRGISRLLERQVGHMVPRLHKGDSVEARGEIIYDIYTKSDHSFEADWLDKGCVLHGRFDTVAVKDYLDEGLLDADGRSVTEEMVRANMRHFGPHIVLSDPAMTMPDGSGHGIPDCVALFIPLTYHRLDLKVRPTVSDER